MAVALFFAVSDDGQHVLVDEIYERFLETPELVRRIREKERALGVRPVLYVPDPQKPEVTKLLRVAGLPIFSGLSAAQHRDRASGFRALVDLLSVDPAVGRSKLLVHARCQATIREWKELRRKEATTAAEAADEWAKSQLLGRQHASDAARYYAKACGQYRARFGLEDQLRAEDRAWQLRQRARLARQRAERRWAGVAESRVG
jgi:hypothetical protein